MIPVYVHAADAWPKDNHDFETRDREMCEIELREDARDRALVADGDNGDRVELSGCAAFGR
jgi:hypothetical protein